MTITDKKYKIYHKCLLKYKKYLLSSFTRQNRERKRLEKELNIAEKYEDRFYGGGMRNPLKSDKTRMKQAEKCVKDFMKALDKEEKELKLRLSRIQAEKESIKRNIRNAMNQV